MCLFSVNLSPAADGLSECDLWSVWHLCFLYKEISKEQGHSFPGIQVSELPVYLLVAFVCMIGLSPLCLISTTVCIYIYCTYLYAGNIFIYASYVTIVSGLYYSLATDQPIRFFLFCIFVCFCVLLPFSYSQNVHVWGGGGLHAIMVRWYVHHAGNQTQALCYKNRTSP